MICQNFPLWPLLLGLPCMPWLIASLSYTSPLTVTRLWSMKGNVDTERSESVSRSVVSNSLPPMDCSLAKLLCPWGSPGRNTGVGCHFLLQGIFPDPGIKPRSPALQPHSLPSEPPGKPLWVIPKKRRKHFPTHSVSSPLLWYQIQTKKSKK